MYENLSKHELLREQARQNMGTICVHHPDSSGFPAQQRKLLWIAGEPHVRLAGMLCKVTTGRITCRSPLMSIWETEAV